MVQNPSPNNNKYFGNIIIQTQTETRYSDGRKLKTIIRLESVRTENVYNILAVLLSSVYASRTRKHLTDNALLLFIVYRSIKTILPNRKCVTCVEYFDLNTNTTTML